MGITSSVEYEEYDLSNQQNDEETTLDDEEKDIEEKKKLLGEEWLPLYEVLLPFEMTDTGMCFVRKETEIEKAKLTETQESDSLIVLTFNYCVEVIELLDKIAKSKRQKNQSCSINEYKKAGRFITVAVVLLLLTTLMTAGQLAVLCRILAWTSDIYFGPQFSASKYSYFFPVYNSTTMSYVQPGISPPVPYIGCGPMMFNSEFCSQLSNPRTQRRIFKQDGGTICAKISPVTKYISYQPSPSKGNMCLSCWAYIDTLTEGSLNYNPMHTWPPNTDKYCNAIICGSTGEWTMYDLFVQPITLLVIIMGITKNVAEMYLCDVIKHRLHKNRKDHSMIGLALEAGLSLLRWMQTFIFCPIALIVSVMMMLVSSDALTMVTNAVAILFLLEVDNVIIGLMLTTKSAVSMMKEEKDKCTVHMTHVQSMTILRKKYTVFLFNYVWSNALIISLVRSKCTVYSTINTIIIVSIFGRFGFIFPELWQTFVDKKILKGMLSSLSTKVVEGPDTPSSASFQKGPSCINQATSTDNEAGFDSKDSSTLGDSPTPEYSGGEDMRKRTSSILSVQNSCTSPRISNPRFTKFLAKLDQNDPKNLEELYRHTFLVDEVQLPYFQCAFKFVEYWMSTIIMFTMVFLSVTFTSKKNIGMIPAPEQYHLFVVWATSGIMIIFHFGFFFGILLTSILDFIGQFYKLVKADTGFRRFTGPIILKYLWALSAIFSIYVALISIIEFFYLTQVHLMDSSKQFLPAEPRVFYGNLFLKFLDYYEFPRNKISREEYVRRGSNFLACWIIPLIYSAFYVDYNSRREENPLNLEVIKGSDKVKRPPFITDYVSSTAYFVSVLFFALFFLYTPSLFEEVANRDFQPQDT